jgi:hypothetical protein
MLHRIRHGLTFANVCAFLALVIALGTGTAYAANTVFSRDIVNGEVKTVDIAGSAVTKAKIGAGAVNGAKVLDGSLTTADLAGASIEGSVSLSVVPNGRCSNVTLGVAGAQVGEVPLVATEGEMQNGIVLHALRVESAGHVEVAVCNLSGTTMTPIDGLAIRVITFD